VQCSAVQCDYPPKYPPSKCPLEVILIVDILYMGHSIKMSTMVNAMKKGAGMVWK
jgi:hypothetical protein